MSWPPSNHDDQTRLFQIDSPPRSPEHDGQIRPKLGRISTAWTAGRMAADRAEDSEQ